MAEGITYGLNFPFDDSVQGDYLQLTETAAAQIRSDLLYLILTRRGSRYYLPDFGTRLYEFIFEPYDGLTQNSIEADIRDSVGKYMPNLIVNKISIEPADPTEEVEYAPGRQIVGTGKDQVYRVPGKGTSEYTAKVIIDYTVDNSAFAQSDFVIINI